MLPRLSFSRSSCARRLLIQLVTQFLTLLLTSSVLLADESLHRDFVSHVKPLLEEHCLDCHNADNMESGIRVDRLDGKLAGRTPFLWSNIRKQLAKHAMPPEDELQPTEDVRAKAIDWIDRALLEAKRRPREKNGAVRRLTVSQYQNTIEALLGIDDDFTSLLPPDAISRDGFLNQEQTMVLSPLLIEAYLEVAERALDLCIVDEQSKPTIQRFRVELGKSINTRPCPDKLILGANSRLLDNSDFTVTQLKAAKPFEFYPFWMRTKYRFHEGYQGNSTVRGWRDYDSIYHAVFACMRGSGGYPKGNAADLVPEGLLLRPAIPSSLLFGKSSTYGPRANFKIALRELPDRGRFRVTVKAAKYNDGLLLENTEPIASDDSLRADVAHSAEANFLVPRDGVYQVDVTTKADKGDDALALTLGERTFVGKLARKRKVVADDASITAFLQVRLPAGPLRMTAEYKKQDALREVALTRIDAEAKEAKQFLKFEQRVPTMNVLLGLRRDCGHTLSDVGIRYRVGSSDLEEFSFEGAINNFPRPEVEEGNDNYLAGVREIAVHHAYTDGRDMPRLLIRSVEFEGPLYESWPPASHRQIFIESDAPADSAEYAREIITRFATRAFRRPASRDEADALLAVWRRSFEETGDFTASMKDALLVALTSPQFLFQIEASESPAAEPVSEFELASKLSFLLWNGPPDTELLNEASEGKLSERLDEVVTRMIADARFEEFAAEFTTQWLGLDKLDVVSFDPGKFRRLTTEAKQELRREPVELLLHLAQNNLPLRNLVKSDFVMANEVVASYYNLADRCESGFEFVALQHDDQHLGGLLSQAGILASLSDGRESNPVKRGAWLARKIIAEPPEDPPPNVPELTADDPTLTLRERLELHRNQPGCVKCHEGIDPWGLPLEEFDAGGRYKAKADTKIDARSILPDTTEVADSIGLKEYLANDRIDQVTFSFLKHVAIYATGRELSFNEIEFLREASVEFVAKDCRVQDLIRFVIASPLFLEK